MPRLPLKLVDLPLTQTGSRSRAPPPRRRGSWRIWHRGSPGIHVHNGPNPFVL